MLSQNINKSSFYKLAPIQIKVTMLACFEDIMQSRNDSLQGCQEGQDSGGISKVQKILCSHTDGLNNLR